MSKIKKIYAREILDSRGNPTIETDVILESGACGSFMVPSGASTGAYEALELRDQDSSRYNGLGVRKAIENVIEKIQPEILGQDAQDQKAIDKQMIELDGTENKNKLGANAILSVSVAVCRAMANELNLPVYAYIAQAFKLSKKFKMPIPMFNIINGGQHSDSGFSIQEYKLVPNGIKKFNEQLRAGSEIFHELKKIISTEGFAVSVGDEGGFAPRLESNARALELINLAIDKAGYKKGQEINLGIDAAASSFFNSVENQYLLKPENVALTREALINIYVEWTKKYNVISVEDGLNEDDFDGWAKMNEKLGKTMNIGDDLLVTNVKRLKIAIAKKACNAVLIKLNQIGTLSETIDCMKLAKKNKMKTVISHRSGETTDDFIADLAVGGGAEYIKSGSLSRGERICKYNRLLKIESEIILKNE